MSRDARIAPIGRLLTGRRWSRSRPWRRSPPVSCIDVAAALPEILDGGRAAPGPMVSHVETCLGCQAELARYRRLVRLLHQLRASDDVVLPAGVMAEVLAALEEAANRRLVRSLLTGRTVMYGGAALAAAGAAIGLVVIARAHAGDPSASAVHEVLS